MTVLTAEYFDRERPALKYVKFADWRSDLLSKPSGKVEPLELKFLDPSAAIADYQDTILMASTPRSGNTFLRGFTDKILGIPTGADEDARHMIEEFGLPGSNVVDRRCQMIKTHYPRDRTDYAQFLGQRVVYLVRNPLDQMTSYFNYSICANH